jgi:hypothetical protein
MHFSIKHIAATINALTRFVRVLDKHPRGAFMLIVVMVVAGGLMAVPQLTAISV